MDILFIIHLLLLLIIASIPFWPIKYLEYGVYIPLILSLIWIFCDGCPLTKIHKTDSDTFSPDVLRFFIPNASEKLSQRINQFLLIAITVIGFRRLNNKK